MTTPYQRRRDPVSYSPGWEIAMAAVAAVLLVLVVGALLGIGLASSLFGEGWAWPSHPNDVGPVLGGLLSGNPAHGFAPNIAGLIASPAAVYGTVVLCETALVGALSWVTLQAVRRFRNDGMATRWEARATLGVTALRRAGPIIRPDLRRTGRREGRR